jgi:hypothetical protein
MIHPLLQYMLSDSLVQGIWMKGAARQHCPGGEQNDHH